MHLETARRGLTRRNIKWLLTRPEIISNQTKSVFILPLVKSFSRQSFRQNYFLSEFECLVLRVLLTPIGKKNKKIHIFGKSNFNMFS